MSCSLVGFCGFGEMDHFSHPFKACSKSSCRATSRIIPSGFGKQADGFADSQFRAISVRIVFDVCQTYIYIFSIFIDTTWCVDFVSRIVLGSKGTETDKLLPGANGTPAPYTWWWGRCGMKTDQRKRSWRTVDWSHIPAKRLNFTKQSKEEEVATCVLCKAMFFLIRGGIGDPQNRRRVPGRVQGGGGQTYSNSCSPKSVTQIADEAYFQFFSFSFLGFLFHHGRQALKEDLAKRLGPAGRLEVTNLENVGKFVGVSGFSVWFKKRWVFFLNLLSPFHFANCADNLECFLNLLDVFQQISALNFACGICHVAPTKVGSMIFARFQDQVKAAAGDHTWLMEPLKELVPSLGWNS